MERKRRANRVREADRVETAENMLDEVDQMVTEASGEGSERQERRQNAVEAKARKNKRRA